MDPKLAEIYGTNVADVDEADVEKLAAAQLAESLASEKSIDLAALSPEQIEELAAAVLKGETEEPAAEEPAEAEAEEKPEVEEPAEKKASAKTDEVQISKEKLAEADYLGRVMAHAYNQELKLIEKKAQAEAATAAAKPAPKVEEKPVEKKASTKTAGFPFKKKDEKKDDKKVEEKKASAEETEEQKLSALDQLAVARAEAWLKENGIEAQPEETEKKSSAISDEQKAVLDNAVEQRAYEMLVSAGYIKPETDEK